ncbi:MAG: hypothetical protein WC881_07510 [Elusimicrobiota bacterium]|jgi:hypothetical protein
MHIRTYTLAAAALFALCPLAHAADSLLAKKEARLKHAAEVLQGLSDEEYLQLSSAPVKASRTAAISAVYGTLAALQYQQALNTGPKAEARPQVEAALRTRTQDAQALAIDPNTLEETGFWGNVVDYINRDDYQPSYRGAAVAAVRGGRSLDSDADKRTAALKKSLQNVEWRLQEPDLEASSQAGLRYEAGRIYESLAGLDAKPAPAPSADQPVRAAPAAQQEDISAEAARMNDLTKKMQEEMNLRRAKFQENSTR